MKPAQKTFSHKAIDFFTKLKSSKNLSPGVGIINPYRSNEVREITFKFYNKFFNDNNKRIFILGINPGRFGGGVTGIPFTDPVALEEHCGIKNGFPKKQELSSKFVYSFIDDFGGAAKFYSKFFISAVFPLALISDGKNYNYYGNKELYQHLKPFLISSLKKQISLGVSEDIVVCLGKKNYYYLYELNKDLNYFKDIITLEHPRFIMQYRLKKKNIYVKNYNRIFRSIVN